MNKKTTRNDPCPCGSGKKYKKCCLSKDEVIVPFTDVDRALALARIETFVMDDLAREDDDAYDDFFAPFSEEEIEDLDSEWIAESEAVFDMWFYFDRPLDGDRSAADLLLAREHAIPLNERRYLQAVKDTSMRLYEVEDLVPGVSVTLRDAMSGAPVTVSERTASRHLTRHSCIAVRIIPRGGSGHPEIEKGCIQIPLLIKARVLDIVRDEMRRLHEEHPEKSDTQCYKMIVPLLHELWLGCIVNPPIPRMTNTDGEDLLWTRVRFDVLDEGVLKSALDRISGLERDSEENTEWHWSGKNANGGDVSLGRIEINEGVLLLETNSVERAKRGRALVEKHGKSAVRHRSTTHENIEATVREGLRSGGGGSIEERNSSSEIPPEIAEELTLDYYAKYYRQWLDLTIPALEGKTPREAAPITRLRPNLNDLISSLEHDYEYALKNNAPAYDPSWMWKELGLSNGANFCDLPPLAHERMALMVDGFGPLCRSLAEQTRKAPGFDERDTVLLESDVTANLEAHRFLRERNVDLVPHLTHMANHAISLHKTFWVDDALVYMLAHTDTDVPGSDLRMPFKSFAMVFTDRHALSLAERLLSVEGKSPLAGSILRVLTVYVTETSRSDNRVIRIAMAPDALGADLPELVCSDIVVPDNALMSGILERAIETQGPGKSKVAAARKGELMGLVFNAVLYATSAGVNAEPKPPRKTLSGSGRRSGLTTPIFTSEEVYHLPGPIEISSAKNLQDLAKTSEGRTLMHRFMVRGHWRRPNPSWKDQKLRWVAPYWKGPDLAAIIERTYRLTT